MKILWLTNKLLPIVAQKARKTTNLVNEGWISGCFDSLRKDTRNEVFILCGSRLPNAKGVSDSFSWYLYNESTFDESHYSKSQYSYFKEILIEVQPDIIHIWGSEYPHTLAMVDAAKSIGMINNVVLWIQGIISQCALPHYFYAGLPDAVINSQTMYDRIMKTSPSAMRANYEARGSYEIEAFEKLKNVIGRTEWDKTCSKLYNPNLHYFHCNETLRDCFYQGLWSWDKCKKYTIFVSQASYSLKGFHMLLQAVALLKSKYPEVCIRVAGYNISDNSFKGRLKEKAYGKYINSLISENALHENITFLGRLNAEQMKNEYLRCNVSACCSSIENSSNSVSESMILGVPVVASRVGGIPSLLKHNLEGVLYQWDNVNELACAIDKIFNNVEFSIKISEASRIRAYKTHNPELNYSTLLSIYQEIKERNH